MWFEKTDLQQNPMSNRLLGHSEFFATITWAESFEYIHQVEICNVEPLLYIGMQVAPRSIPVTNESV